MFCPTGGTNKSYKGQILLCLTILCFGVFFTSRAAAESNSGVGGRCSSADVCLIGFIGVKVSPVGVVLQQTFVS